MRITGMALIAALALAGCGGSGALHSSSSRLTGPDEFRVLPANPLVMPANFAELPTPTPGASNLAEPQPIAAAVAALGGRVEGGVAGDAALIAQVSRYGVTADIRTVTAEEDSRYRKIRGRFGLFGGDNYFRTYRRMALDAFAELIRFRDAGVDVPSAPPSR